MNRRDVLGAGVALAVAPVLPSAPSPVDLLNAMLDRAVRLIEEDSRLALAGGRARPRQFFLAPEGRWNEVWVRRDGRTEFERIAS